MKQARQAARGLPGVGVLSMVENLPAQKLYDFIVNDFECAWNSLAADRMATGRGNFMFAMQAVTLLESAARLCMSDPQRVNGQPVATREFAQQLGLIEPKYFTELPRPCADFRDFILPSYPLMQTNPESQLLWAVFDLIRNGQAHQYQQIIVDLTDKRRWAISLTGATPARHLGAVRPPDHLGYRRDGDGDIGLLVYPDVIFVDVRTAIAASGILSQGLSFQYLRRPKVKTQRANKPSPGPFYQFSSTDLEKRLGSCWASSLEPVDEGAAPWFLVPGSRFLRAPLTRRWACDSIAFRKGGDVDG